MNTKGLNQSGLLYDTSFINQNYRKTTLNQSSEDSSDESKSEDEDSQDDNSYNKKGNQNQNQNIINYNYQDTPHFIVISTLDRDWTSNNPNITQYNFQVKFAPSGDSLANKPLYYNNPTIPATPEQASKGLRGDPNVSGWFGENGVFYPPYQASQPFGDIVGYEKIVEKGQTGLALNNSFKNIVKLELLGAMIPSVQRQVEYHPTLRENVVDEIYYMMEIEEVKDVIEGTSRDLNNSFAILIPFVKIYDLVTASAKAIEYKIAGMWNKVFSPAPLSSLTNLTFIMKKPTGSILQNLNDTLDIKFIYQYQENLSDTRTDVLIIETNQYFTPTEYKPTDTILIKNYLHYLSSISPSPQYLSNFNNFINRNEGHRILTTSSNDPSLFLHNRIHIPRPAELSINTGGLSEEPWYSLIKTTVIDNETTITTRSTYDTGRLINIDLQTLYFFRITTRDKNISHILNNLNV